MPPLGQAQGASPEAKRRLERMFMRLQLAILEEVAALIDRALGRGTIVPQPPISVSVIPPGSGDWDGPIDANVVRRIQGFPVSELDPTEGQVLKDVGGTWTPSTLTGTGHTIEDEGTPLTQRTLLNFVGAGVTVTDSGGTTTLVTIPGSTDTDEKAKVSSNDTTAGYLNGKLVAGAGITLTENNDGSNETLTIAATASAAGQYRQFVYTVGGGTFEFLTFGDGSPMFVLEDLE